MTASDSPQIDPAMLELFAAEMDTHIPVLNEGILALEKGQAGAREIEGMMRAAHSIKGAARIVGMDSAVRVAHVMEDCFTAAKENRITLTSDCVDVLLAGVDALQRICAPQSGEPLADESRDELVGRLTQLKSGQTPAKASPAPSLPTPPARVEVVSEPSGVALPAAFDDASCEAVRRELVGAIARGVSVITLDFARVGELDANGLALLVSFAHEVAHKQPAALAIESRRIGPAVRTVLCFAGLHGVFGIGR